MQPPFRQKLPSAQSVSLAQLDRHMLLVPHL
jgi:hypothetical protein